MKDLGLSSRYQLQARFSNRELQVYPGSLQAQMIMRSAPLEEPRRKVYVAAHTSDPEQLQLLETLLRARAYLAQVLGHDSFSRLTLSDKMAKSPGQYTSLRLEPFIRLTCLQKMSCLSWILCWITRNHMHDQLFIPLVPASKLTSIPHHLPSYKHGIVTTIARLRLPHHQYLCLHLPSGLCLWACPGCSSTYMASLYGSLMLLLVKCGIPTSESWKLSTKLMASSAGSTPTSLLVEGKLAEQHTTLFDVHDVWTMMTHLETLWIPPCHMTTQLGTSGKHHGEE
jgi:hypothetical protein